MVEKFFLEKQEEQGDMYVHPRSEKEAKNFLEKAGVLGCNLVQSPVVFFLEAGNNPSPT